MKKFVFAALLTLGMISTSQAFIAVQWQGLDGFVAADGTTPLTQGGGSTIAYLVFSPNNSSYGVSLNAGNFTQGSEVILGPVVNISGDDYATVFTQNSPPVAFQSGFIYARVFDNPTSTAVGQPLAGTRYYEGPLVAAADITDLSAPQFYNMNTGSAGIPGFATDIVNRTVVPEPSVLAFLGIGGLVLAFRRRKA